MLNFLSQLQDVQNFLSVHTGLLTIWILEKMHVQLIGVDCVFLVNIFEWSLSNSEPSNACSQTQFGLSSIFVLIIFFLRSLCRDHGVCKAEWISIRWSASYRSRHFKYLTSKEFPIYDYYFVFSPFWTLILWICRWGISMPRLVLLPMLMGTLSHISLIYIWIDTLVWRTLLIFVPSCFDKMQVC